MGTTSQYINDNFAIFLDGSSDKYNFDIHINDWIVYPFDSYIDFGIKIYDISHADSISLYTPYKINVEEIQDLSPLYSNEKIARALTNTFAKITTSNTSPIIEINYHNITESIIFLSALTPFIKTCEDGTLIRFSLNNVHPYIKNNIGYIRFRIPHKSLNKIFTVKKHDYKFSFDSPIITDKYQHTVKINEFRALPFEIRQMLSLHEQVINKGMFFLIASDKINTDDNICDNIRLLENDLFESYTPITFQSSSALVYKWDKRPKEYLNFSFKCSTSRIKILSLVIYSLIIILLTIIGNILWELLKLLPLFNWVT